MQSAPSVRVHVILGLGLGLGLGFQHYAEAVRWFMVYRGHEWVMCVRQHCGRVGIGVRGSVKVRVRVSEGGGFHTHTHSRQGFRHAII